MLPVVKRRGLVVVVAVLLLLTVCTGSVVAQGTDEGTEAGDGDELLEVSGWTAVAALLIGTVVLIASVELLIHALVRTALRFGVSAFLMAVVFSGWEFDNVAVGLFTGFAEMQNVALGLAIGNAVSIFGLTLALGALLFPFAVDVPDDYLVMTVAAPLLLVPALLSGSLTPAMSVMFLVLYVVIFAYILGRERGRDRTFMESSEVHEAAAVPDGAETRLPSPVRSLTQYDWFWPAMLVVAIGGIALGAEGSASGIEGILETWNLTETFLGVTVITLLYTLDDIVLILEPLRLGYNDVAVGGVIGSLLFFVTANVGIVGLLGTIHFRWETVFVHLPTLLGFAALSSYLLWRGEMTKKHGALLLGLYVTYLLVNVQFFATLPVGE